MSGITSPSLVEKLRRSLEQSRLATEAFKQELDEDEAAGLSLDNSMTREGSDIEKLARMLAEQTETSNRFIEQCQRAESELAKNIAEGREREKRFQETIQTLTAVRDDNVDLKRKINLAQEQVQRATEDADRARVEAAIKQRELDKVLSANENFERDLELMRQERDDARREIDRARNQHRALEEELARFRDEEAVRAAERRADVEQASREASNAKLRVGPLEAELKAERERSEELAQALRQRTAELKECQQQLAEARANAFQHKDRADRAAANEKELERDLEEKVIQLAQAEARIQSASEMVAAAEADVSELQKDKAQWQQVKRELENEVKEVKLQLEAVANDLQTQAMGRRADRERYEEKVAQLEAELDGAVQEARSIGRNLSDDNVRIEQQFAEQRRALEDSRSRLQEENVELRELLANYQREQAVKQQEFQTEREAYEERLAENIRKQRQLEAMLSTRELAEAEGQTKWREKLLEAQNQLGQHTKSNVNTLGALEDTLQKLAVECQRLQSAHDGLLDEVAIMRATLRDYAEKGDAQIEEWHASTRRAMQALVDSMEQTEQEAREAREAQFQAEAQRDEDRGRSFMLEEERTRLEEEVRELEDRLRQLDRSVADKLRKAQQDVDLATGARADAEAAVRRLQDQLDRANSTSRGIQGDMDRTQQLLAEAQAKARDKLALMEDRVGRLEAGILKAQAEKDAAVAEQQLLRKKIESQAQEIADLLREIKVKEESKRGVDLSGPKELAELQRKYHLAMDNFHKQGTQLNSLKSLVQVLTTQREQVQEENKALKEQLNELLGHAVDGVHLLEGGGSHQPQHLLGGSPQAGGAGGA